LAGHEKKKQLAKRRKRPDREEKTNTRQSPQQFGVGSGIQKDGFIKGTGQKAHVEPTTPKAQRISRDKKWKGNERLRHCRDRNDPWRRD